MYGCGQNKTLAPSTTQNGKKTACPLFNSSNGLVLIRSSTEVCINFRLVTLRLDSTIELLFLDWIHSFEREAYWSRPKCVRFIECWIHWDSMNELTLFGHCYTSFVDELWRTTSRCLICSLILAAMVPSGEDSPSPTKRQHPVRRVFLRNYRSENMILDCLRMLINTLSPHCNCSAPL